MESELKTMPQSIRPRVSAVIREMRKAKKKRKKETQYAPVGIPSRNYTTADEE